MNFATLGKISQCGAYRLEEVLDQDLGGPAAPHAARRRGADRFLVDERVAVPRAVALQHARVEEREQTRARYAALALGGADAYRPVRLADESQMLPRRESACRSRHRPWHQGDRTRATVSRDRRRCARQDSAPFTTPAGASAARRRGRSLWKWAQHWLSNSARWNFHL